MPTPLLRSAQLAPLLMLLTLTAHAAPLLLDVSEADIPGRRDEIIFVPTIEDSITLDGRLGEKVWRKAAMINQWVDRSTSSPTNNVAKMAILRGSDGLYIAFMMKGIDHLKFKEPSKEPKDEYGDSVFELFFDPYNNHRTTIQFVTNPKGMRYDRQDWDRSWSGQWKTASSLDNDTWTTEIFIPNKDLRNQTRRQFWKANFAIYLNAGFDGAYSWTGGWGNPDQDYGVLFFGTEQEYRRTLRTKAHLFLDRKVYDTRDTAAKSLLKIDAIGNALDTVRINVRTHREGRVVAEQTISKLPSNELDLTINLNDVSEGDYSLEAKIIRDREVIAKAEQAFSVKRRTFNPPAQTSGRIAIRVHGQPYLAGHEWLITTGVPFANGSLMSTDHVRLLDPDGNEVPCQPSVRATWSPRGPIQWMGLDFVPTIAAEDQQYTLEYGPHVRRKPYRGLVIRKTGNTVQIDTGPLKMTVDRKQFNLIASAALDGKRVLEPTGQPSGLSLVDHEGNRYHAALDRDVDVTVEDEGPVRATICAKGWYVREGSKGEVTSVELPTDRLCVFTVRMTVFAGSPIVQAAVSTTITYDTTKVRLRELTIGLPIGDNKSVTVGELSLSDKQYLLQHRWDQSIDATGETHNSAAGWVKSPNVTFAMRRFRQLFPKEIGYRDGMLTMHPWPAHGRDVFSVEEQTKISNTPYLWYAHHGKELDFTFPESYYKALDAYYDRSPSGTTGRYYQQMRKANAQGLTIHNDLLLSFGDMPPDKLASLANTPPLAAADPEYACATGVFGPMLHADEDYAELENTIASGYRHLSQRTTTNGGKDFGQFIFGNLHNHWNFKEKAGHIHRVWSNGHYHIARIPFIYYVRTGDPMWMQWGRDHANTIRDIAMVNYVSPQRSFPYHQLGAMYHCKGFAPWAGDAHVAAHPICMDFLIYDYYLFGNRRSLDAIQNWITGIKQASPGGQSTREGMTTMAELIEAYRLTWDATLVELLDRYREEIIRVPFEEHNSWDFHTLLLVRDWSLSGDERMVKTFRDAVNKNSNGNSHIGTIHHQGFFALVDDESKRVEGYGARLYREQIGVLDRSDIGQFDLTRYAWIQQAYLMHKTPYLLKAMDHFGIKPKLPAQTVPMPLPVAGKTARIVVKEQSDQAFSVKVNLPRPSGKEMAMRIMREDGQQVAELKIPAEQADPMLIEVPSDGVVGEYMIVIDNYDIYANVNWPLTDLKHEVAVTPPGQTLQLLGADIKSRTSYGSRVFMNPPNAQTKLNVSTDSKNVSALHLYDCEDCAIAKATTSRYIGPRSELVIPADLQSPISLYLNRSATIESEQGKKPLIIAPRPDALFEPTMSVDSE